jgi:glucosamine 6-phosphate synthetase-like amidotransferase/phosphosugar isomerase protein
MERTLKLKKICHIHVEVYAAGELKHGRSGRSINACR